MGKNSLRFTRLTMRTLLLVGLFGALGAASRWQICKWMPRPEDFPMGTFAVNIIGCLFLGILTGMALTSDEIPQSWRTPLITGITTGFLGSFTTFSTFAVESLQLIEGSQWKFSILYLGGQIIIGLLLAWLGLYIGRQLCPTSA